MFTEFWNKPINFDIPKKITITIPQQQVIGKIYQIFGNEMTTHLPNYNRQIPRFEEYKVIIEALGKDNPVLKKFITEYGKENQQRLEQEGKEIAERIKTKRFVQQKQATKQQFKTASQDIKDRLDISSKEQLGTIKEARKLIRNHSISEDRPTKSHA